MRKGYRMSRDELFENLRKQGIYTRKYFCPLTSEQKCYEARYEQEQLSNVKEISKRIFCLPFYADLEDNTIKNCRYNKWLISKVIGG